MKIQRTKSKRELFVGGQGYYKGERERERKKVNFWG